MFLKDTLYVTPNINITRVKAAIQVQDIQNHAYQVFDIWYTDDQVQYGVVNERNQMYYLPFNCWLVLDSKTKKLFYNPDKEVTNGSN